MDKPKPSRPILHLPVKPETKETLDKIKDSLPANPPSSPKSPEPTESLPPLRKHETPQGGSQRATQIVSRYLRIGKALRKIP